MTTIEHTVVPTTVVGNANGASWPAVFFGIFIAIAVYFLLLTLGIGLGFTVISPWDFKGYTAQAIGLATVFWLLLMQIISAATGGYFAGRLAPSASANLDRPLKRNHFNSIAHGLVVWAASSMIVAILLGSVAAGLISGGASALTSIGQGVVVGAGVVSSAGGVAGYIEDEDDVRNKVDAKADSLLGNIDYTLDFLFRPNEQRSEQRNEQSARDDNDRIQRSKEAIRIIINAVQQKNMPDNDKQYIASIVAKRAGISQEEALGRVERTLNQINNALDKAEAQAKEALDTGRKAAATAALWTFFSLLLGAIVAGAAACYGGNRKNS